MTFRDLKPLDAVSPSELVRRSLQAQHAAAAASWLVGERGAATLAVLVAQGAPLSDAATTALGEVHYAELTEPPSAAALLEVERDVSLLAYVRDALEGRVNAFLEGAAPASAERLAASELGRAGWPTPIAGRETLTDWIKRAHAVAVENSSACGRGMF